MIARDYSPPTSPSLDEQRDALGKGLGRAVLWAISGCLDEGLLLEASLCDQRFDRQIEGARGAWLWQMMEALGSTSRFGTSILQAVRDFSDVDSAEQLCELAHRYAKLGDADFRQGLWDIVEQVPFPQMSWLGQREIIDLDGESAFTLVAHMVGGELLSRDWEEWNDGALLSLAENRIGQDRVQCILEASSDEAIQRFRMKSLRAKQTAASADERPRPPPVSMTVSAVLEAAQGTDRCLWFRAWGREADEAALQAISQRLWNERDARVIGRLLRVFFARGFPQFDERLLELCRHDYEEVRRSVYIALKPLHHPLVRDFALAELNRPGHDLSVVELFVNNYESGDEELIVQNTELPEDRDRLHYLLMAFNHLLNNNPAADCRPLGLISYALNPCAECRCFAARIILRRKAAPTWLIEECHYDSHEDCRQLVKEAAC